MTSRTRPIPDDILNSAESVHPRSRTAGSVSDTVLKASLACHTTRVTSYINPESWVTQVTPSAASAPRCARTRRVTTTPTLPPQHPLFAHAPAISLLLSQHRAQRSRATRSCSLPRSPHATLPSRRALTTFPHHHLVHARKLCARAIALPCRTSRILDSMSRKDAGRGRAQHEECALPVLHPKRTHLRDALSSPTSRRAPHTKSFPEPAHANSY